MSIINNLPSLVIIGEHFIHRDRLSSTNAYAAELLSKDKPAEGTVISTNDQYAGRGQLQNAWESQPNKNISLSIILYPDFLEVGQQFLLNQAVSLAVYDCIKEFAPTGTVKIKWPNDIYLDNRKVCGILIQNQIQGKKISTSIVGVGINVNQRVFHSDAPNPISLIHILDQQISLDSFRKTLFGQLTARYHALKMSGYKTLEENYLAALYQKGDQRKYRVGSSEIQGVIMGVNQSGQLQLMVDGNIQQFGFKEISFL